jgi:hypothetical protein
VLLDSQTDSTNAVLASGGTSQQLGLVSRDAEPAFTPGGGRGAIRTAGGVMVFEP